VKLFTEMPRIIRQPTIGRPLPEERASNNQPHASMNNPLFKVILLALSVAAANGLQAGAKGQAPMPIADGTKIVVHYSESLQGGLNPDSGEMSRRSSFSRVVEEAFADANLQVEVEVVQLGSKKTGDLNITVNVTRWQLNQMSQYECRFAATISNDSEKIELGVFVGKLDGATMQQGTEYTYDVAARRAVDQMVKRFTRA
jgi:hypothetical protein